MRAPSVSERKVKRLTRERNAARAEAAELARKLVGTRKRSRVLARRAVELTDGLYRSEERQQATAEILRIISGSRESAQPVFDAILASLLRLFDGFDASVWLVEKDHIVPVVHGGPTAPKSIPPQPLSREYGGALAILDRKVDQVDDVEADPNITESHRRDLRFVGRRSVLRAPLLRDGEGIGLIAVSRTEPTKFTAKQISLIQTFADQAVIAIENVRLFKELEARNQDLSETLQQQEATGDVLRIISGSLTDAKPVFDAILASILRLFHGFDASVWLVDGDHIAPVVHGGPTTPESLPPLPLSREYLGSLAILDRKVEHTDDVETDPNITESYRRALLSHGRRSMLRAPLLRAGEGIGLISVSRTEPTKFTEKQISLIQTFADQAVIAIENVRLFKELEARNKDLAETLEQQTATSEILRIISSSPTDIQPVFGAITESAMRLFNGMNAFLALIAEDRFEFAAGAARDMQVDRFRSVFPFPVTRDTTSGRAALDREVLGIADLLGPDVPEETKRLSEKTGARSGLFAPLLREGAAIGVLNLIRGEPGPFSEKQVALLQTFADQAVIAIQNARLFKELEARNAELAETVRHQTATSEVLRIVSQSLSDTKPVFDAILQSLLRLFEGFDASVWLVDGDQIRPMVHGGPTTPPKLVPGPMDSDIGVAPALRDHPQNAQGGIRGVYRIDDVDNDAWVPDAQRERLKSLGRGSVLNAALFRDGKAIGVLGISRGAPTRFSEKQVKLLQTFADQAVIAIENVRLFKELEARNKDLAESLEQQTATAELLRAISRTSFELDAVLQSLMNSAARSCSADVGVLFRSDGQGNYRPAVHFGFDKQPEALQILEHQPLRVGRDTVTGRALLERNPVHIADVGADRDYQRFDLLDRLKTPTLLAVPMLRDGEAIGVITMLRGPQVRPFSDKQIELVMTFADQAVIAIENVRLIEEIQEKSAQLEAANRHKSEFLANMSHELRTPLNAIIGFSEVLADKMFGEVNDKQLQYLKTIHASGHHLLSLINDILDLSKIEAGRMELELSSFNLGAALDNALTLIRERAGRHGVALELQCSPELREWTADERKFKQVMLNLLSNAVKFTPQGGKITVKASRASGGIEVSVSDTGVGIAKQDQELVFEEFRQAGRDRLKKAEGTGLGLALTRKFVELHGGKITLESEPGKGSTFTFTLPERSREAA